jgi:hypothetical protein
MKIKRDALLESIKELNKKKPLKENIEEDLGNTKVDITATLDPAGAARMQEHENAIKSHDKRIADSYKTKEVKEFLKETSSEESRYAHFDCVDRKDLAKRINEAKEKGLDFRVGRSDKRGYRYTLDILKEEYLKKDAGIPEINTATFNHAAGADSACTGTMCESVNEGDGVVIIDTSRDGYGIGQVVNNCFTVGELIEFLSREYDENMPVVLSFDRGYTYGALNGGCFRSENATAEDAEDSGGSTMSGDEDLEEEISAEPEINEELQIYTSRLSNFHPSERSRETWQRIKDAKKVEDLEYALETLYPDGISDVALDDLLANESDWILDLVGITEEPEEDSVDDFKDEEIEPFDDEDAYDEVEDVVDEPVDSDVGVKETAEDKWVDDELGGVPYDAYDDDDDIEPIDMDVEEGAHDEAIAEVEDEKSEEGDDEDDDKKDLKESKNVAKGKETDEKTETAGNKVVEPDDKDDDLTEAIGDGFVKSAYKEGLKCTEEEFGKITPQEQIKEAVESIPEEDGEVVAVDDSEINEMCGFAKPTEDKKEESK